MSHRQIFGPERLRGLLVLVLAAGLALPALVAAGGRASDSTADAVIALARAQVGDAYVWGGTGPDTWDCSGLTGYVWREAGGVVLPRVSGDQQKRTVAIPREQLLPGDLAFFGDPVTHVALYVGDGRVVDASSAKTGVLERPLWTAKVVRYGRVARPDMPPVQPWTPPSPSDSPTTAGSGASPAPTEPAPSEAAAPAATRPQPSTPAPSAGAGAGAARPTSPATPRPSASPTPARPATSPTPSRPSASPTPARPATSPTAVRPATSPTPARPSASPTPTTRATQAAATRPSASPAAPAPRPTTPAAKPAVTPTTRPTTSPTTRPTMRPAASAPATARPASSAPRPAPVTPTAVRPLASLPTVQARPSSAVAVKAVAAARALAGATAGDDVSLVRAVWLRAGGLRLPADRASLVTRARQVARPDVRVGDLVSYGTPSTQVYLYAGHGYMVGWDAEHASVVVRRVHTGDVRFLRLPTS